MKAKLEKLCPSCFEKGFTDRCKICGYIYENNTDDFALKPNTILHNRYYIGKILGRGGFGIVYFAYDSINKIKCVVKEFFPAKALRNKDNGIYLNDGCFDSGLQAFKNEIEMMMLFQNNPSIIQVYDYFEENNTVYCSMEYLDGVTLKSLVISLGGKMPYDMAYRVIEKVTYALSSVHDKGIVHGDISPENIFVNNNAEIKLIDFGAAFNFTVKATENPSVMLKPGFAPPEQYSRRRPCGPWSDVYSLAATFYYTLTGTMVPEAPERLMNKGCLGIATEDVLVNKTISDAIEKGLELDYKKRFQSVEEFFTAITGV